MNQSFWSWMLSLCKSEWQMRLSWYWQDRKGFQETSSSVCHKFFITAWIAFPIWVEGDTYRIIPPASSRWPYFFFLPPHAFSVKMEGFISLSQDSHSSICFTCNNATITSHPSQNQIAELLLQALSNIPTLIFRIILSFIKEVYKMQLVHYSGCFNETAINGSFGAKKLVLWKFCTLFVPYLS